MNVLDLSQSFIQCLLYWHCSHCSLSGLGLLLCYYGFTVGVTRSKSSLYHSCRVGDGSYLMIDYIPIYRACAYGRLILLFNGRYKRLRVMGALRALNLP